MESRANSCGLSPTLKTVTYCMKPSKDTKSQGEAQIPEPQTTSLDEAS